MRVKGLICAVLFSLLTACGSDSTTTTGQGLSQVPQDPRQLVSISQNYLLGTWSSNCVLDPKRSGIYIKEYLQYDVDQMNRLTTSYLDSACSAVLYQTNLESSYLFSSTGIYSETRKSVAVTPLSSTAISLFTRGQGFCGDISWRLNTERTLRNVVICGFDQVANMSLIAHDDGRVAELAAHECEPGNPRDCTDLSYFRAH